jgi:hypothetical protein
MPQAVDPGIESGFKAADQQSYLQQVLANTRAEQNNAAQLKAKQEERIFDPSTLEDPNMPPEEHAARKRDMLSFAQGAQPGPDGRPLAVYKTSDELKNALDFMKTQAGQRASVQGDKNLADATEQNLQPQHMAKDGSGKPDPLIASKLAVLRGSNPLDPNRAEARKVIGDLGLYKASVPLGGQGVDTTGQPTGPANMPQFGAGSGGAEVSVDSPEGQKRIGQGWKPEQKTVKDAYGRETVTTAWNPPSSTTGFDDLAALRALKALGQMREDANLTNLSDPEWEKVYSKKSAMQSGAAGDKARSVTVNNMSAKAEGPLEPKALGDWFNPARKQFAVNDPSMRGANPQKLQDAGYLHTSAWGTSKDMVAEIQNVNTADAHLDNLRKFIDRNPDLYPDFDAAHPLTGAASARVQQAWRGILDGSDPRIAELKALDRSSLNILAAIAPPKNMRSGYSLLRYASEGLINPNAVMSHQGALANIQGWTNSVKAASKGRLTAVNGPQGPQVGTDIDQRPDQVAPSTAAGVSGLSPFAQWDKANPAKGAR